MWYLERRQPEIMTGTCDQPICSDTELAPGKVFYAHPGNWTGGTELARANYTLHESSDGGASWALVDRVYALGAGYAPRPLPALPGRMPEFTREHAIAPQVQ